MKGSRKISFIVRIDYDKSMEEIKNRRSGFLIEMADKLLKVAVPLRGKMVIAFLKLEKSKLLTGLNEYLQIYELGRVRDFTMEDVMNRSILFQLEDVQINYQELSEWDIISNSVLKKVIQNMKYGWVEERVISLLNSKMINKKILGEISPKASDVLWEKWGVCASIVSFAVR